MSIELSRETETRITDEARREGITVEALLGRLIGERLTSNHLAGPTRELPVWHLGGADSLHRRDIYDDVR